MFTKLTDENRRPGTIGIIILAATGLMLFSAQSKADTGFFIGGSVGQAGIELNDGDPVLPVVVDEDDLGYKLFAGYNWQFTILSLGVEAGYVNLGKPSADIPGFGVLDIETTGLNAFGVLGVQLGPIGLFGKLGVMSWEADLSLDGIPDPTGSEDGTETMYGVGAKVDIGSLGIRLEYEAIDLDADGVSESDANMISLGLTWTF